MDDRYPVSVNGKLNPVILSKFNNHKILTSSSGQREVIEDLLNATVKVFGTTLSVGVRGLSSANMFYVDLRQEAHSASPYLERQDQEIFIAKADYRNNLLVFSLAFSLHSEVAQSTLPYYQNIWSSHQFDAALLSFHAYTRGLKKYVKKHSLNKQQTVDFANAVELHAQYANNISLPTNTVNHIARAIKGGLSVDKAIWMASSNVPSKMADEFVDIPLEWLDKLY